jgi:transposase
VDKVRSEEHRGLMSAGDDRLKHTRFEWLRNAMRTDNRGRRTFMVLARSALKTARAWAMKETASGLWDFSYRKAAEKAWSALLRWLARSRLEPMIKVGKMIKTFLWGILNAIMARANNAACESKNAVIQKIKARACGFRSRVRFKQAILFHLGKLDMTPHGWHHPTLGH